MKATKVRLYPTTEQAEFLHRQFGAVPCGSCTTVVFASCPIATSTTASP
ncbi:helix-turn-helix domain-containing protein [Azotobacter beijerinckii]